MRAKAQLHCTALHCTLMPGSLARRAAPRFDSTRLDSSSTPRSVGFTVAAPPRRVGITSLSVPAIAIAIP